MRIKLMSDAHSGACPYCEVIESFRESRNYSLPMMTLVLPVTSALLPPP